MKKRVRSWVLYVVIGLLLGGTIRLGGSGGGMTLNYVFLAVMGILILLSDLSGISKIISMTGDLKNIISNISGGKSYDAFMDEMADNGGKPGSERQEHNKKYLEIMEALKFGQETANEDWQRLLKDWQASEGMDCDVEDYLSEDEMLEGCNYNICMQIPGVLTALGILGTFLGLVLGLRSFDFSNADQMTSSVEALVSGLNVAFYTSIYGVTLSILYNLVFRRIVTDLNKNLNRFYDVFHAALIPASQKDMVSQFSNYEEQQNGLLEDIRQLMEERFGERLAGQMAQTLTPVFERINQSLDHMMLDFHKEQRNSLEKIVDAFVVQMSSSLDQHIHVLGDSVDQLSQTQNVMSTELKKLIDQIAKTGADTAQINEQAGNILAQLNGYVTQLEKTTNTSAEIIHQMSGWSENIEHMSEVQNEILQTLAVHEKNLDETCMKINENQTVLTERLEAFTEAAGMIAAREQDPLQFNDLKDMLTAYMQSQQQLQNTNVHNMEEMWSTQLQESRKQLSKLTEQLADQQTQLRQTLGEQQSQRDNVVLEQMAQLLKTQQDLVYLNGRIYAALANGTKEGKIELPSGGGLDPQTAISMWMEIQNRKMDEWMNKQEVYQKQMLQMAARSNRSIFSRIRNFFGGSAE